MNGDSTTEIRSVSLDLLRSGFPQVPPACGELHAQAASVCLAHHGHPTGVLPTISGDFSETVRVEWTDEIDEAVIRYWADLTEAVEQGAVGIAILLARLLGGYTVVERAVKGTGIDWWMGRTDDPLFQRKARLEVSGILGATAGQVAARAAAKVEQTKQSDDSGLEAYVVVVEFSAPRSQVLKR